MDTLKEIKIKKEMKEFIDNVLQKFDYSESKIIPILQHIQDKYNYLPQESIDYVAYSLNISPAKVFGVATFYAHFSIEPKGKYIIKVCDGTACHVKKSEKILEKIYEVLKLDKSKKTTEDLLFTVETVSCLGACGLAPVMLINEDVYGAMTPEKVEEVLKEIINKEKSNEN